MFSKYFKHIFSVIFFITVFLFWRLGYACAFSYHEQFQMFLFTKSYFLERMSLPGGLSDYISEFLVQFYYFPLFGSLIISGLLLVVQILSYQLMKCFSAKDFSYILSFLPSILLWRYLGNESVLLSFVVSCIAALIFDLGYVSTKKNILKILYASLGVVLFYYFFGAIAFSSCLFFIVYDIKEKNNIITSVLAVLCSVFFALICYNLMSYPLFRFFVGINYFRFPTEIPLMQIIIMFFLAVFPLFGLLEKKLNKKLSVSTLVLIIVFIFFYVPSGFNELNYEVIEYDYLVRTGNWDKIISISEKKNPRTPQSVSCLNLALVEKGMLGDRMFNFFQNGGHGLIPVFTRDFFLPLSASEIYLRLSMVNSSLRNLFEAQEAIPNYRKSARITKRLAELNILNKDYLVAQKYLEMLSNTLFYKDFAKDLMKNPEKLTENKFWSEIDKSRYQKDFLFSESEPDQMFGLLLEQNEKNRLACDYLIAEVLLEKDLQKFINYYTVCQNVGYKVLPKHFQEALIYAYYKTHGNLSGIPPIVTAPVVNEFQQFMQIYSQNPQAVKNSPLENSFYAYFFNLK